MTDISKALDEIILEVVYQAGLMPRGKTIGANKFPGAKSKLTSLLATIEAEARLKVYREALDNLHHSSFKSYIMELYNADLKALKAIIPTASKEEGKE